MADNSIDEMLKQLEEDRKKYNKGHKIRVAIIYTLLGIQIGLIVVQIILRIKG